MNEAVRFGLVGFGAWGQCHAAAIEKMAGAELFAIASKSESTLQKARSQYPNTKCYLDYREVIGNPNVDVVAIVVPSHLHHQVASLALQGGKHVLLEKPMCLNLELCDDLIRTAKSASRLLAIGHELRLSSLWSRVKQLIDDGFVGRPQYALVELSRNPYRLGADRWRYDIDRVGNWILEEPIHFFDFARWYLASEGEPETVYAQGNSKQENHPELQDNFSAILNFRSGAYAVVSQTLSAFEHHQTVKVTGTHGALWASWSGAMDRTRHPSYSLKAFDGAEVRELPIDKITGEVYELEDQVAMMVNAVRDGAPLRCTALDGRQSVAMCMAAQQSVESADVVEIASYTG